LETRHGMMSGIKVPDICFSDYKRIFLHVLVIYLMCIKYGSSWWWSYGSWIYNYLCNQYPSPL